MVPFKELCHCMVGVGTDEVLTVNDVSDPAQTVLLEGLESKVKEAASPNWKSP